MGRRIGGAGGGSDKGTSSHVVVGAVAAIAIASAGGGASVGIGAAGGSSSTGTIAESVASRNIVARKANGKRAASRGNADEAWRRMGMRGVRKNLQQNLSCVVNSFGQVREFFLRTPCRSLDRALFAIDDGQGDLIVVSVAWVGFRTRGQAQRFKDLDDTYGTGNVSPIGGAVLGLADVHFTGQHYRSRRTGTTTVVAEAEPVDGPVEDAVLDAVAEVAVLLPNP